MPRPIGSNPSKNSRRAGILAALATVVIILGCMSIEIGTRKEDCCHSTPEGMLVQTGCTVVSEKSTECVYYPIPYASPPNLEISCAFDHCIVSTQGADHFCIENPNLFSRKVTWKARGVRVTPIPPIPTAVIEKTETAPAPTPAH